MKCAEIVITIKASTDEHELLLEGLYALRREWEKHTDEEARKNVVKVNEMINEMGRPL